MANRIYIRGDCHGDFDWVKNFCANENTDITDIIILAGDSGLLFYGPTRTNEILIKTVCAKAPVTFLVVRGNHDNRPANEGMHIRYHPIIDGGCYWEDEYSNILYAAEIGYYKIYNKYFLTIGGAYSVDKYYRLMKKWNWYEDEELTDKEMDDALKLINGETVDYVITHTCPLELEPTDLFMSIIDQKTVSKRMEIFLQRIKNCVNYKMWFFGHFHKYREYARLDVAAPPSIDDPAHVMLYNEIIHLTEDNFEVIDYLT